MQRQLLCSPQNPLTPPKSPQNMFPSFLGVGGIADGCRGFTAALESGSGCKNLGLIILEVLYNLNDSMRKRRTGQQ